MPESEEVGVWEVAAGAGVAADRLCWWEPWLEEFESLVVEDSAEHGRAPPMSPQASRSGSKDLGSRLGRVRCGWWWQIDGGRGGSTGGLQPPYSWCINENIERMREKKRWRKEEKWRKKEEEEKTSPLSILFCIRH